MRKVMEDKNGRRFFIGQRVVAHSHGCRVNAVIRKFLVKKEEAEIQILNKNYNFYFPLAELEFCHEGRETKNN